jgi:hypothetical protein
MKGKMYSLHVWAGQLEPAVLDHVWVPAEDSGFIIFMLMLGDGSFFLASW